MFGVRFYLDYVSAKRKRRGEHNGNVIAAHVTVAGRSWSHVGIIRKWKGGKVHFSVECVSALSAHPNSDVCSSSVSQGYLQDSCKFISEEKAREIHPALFAYMDLWGEEISFDSIEEEDVPDEG